MFDFYPTCLEKTKHVGIFTPGCYFPHMFGFWHTCMGKGTHVSKKPHNYMFENVWLFPHMCGKSHWHAYFPLSYRCLPTSKDQFCFDQHKKHLSSSLCTFSSVSGTNFWSRGFLFFCNFGQRRLWRENAEGPISEGSPNVDLPSPSIAENGDWKHFRSNTSPIGVV